MSNAKHVKATERNSGNFFSFQLKEMSDRLPPLSPFSSGFKLDDWQIQVLELIDENKSVIVCAPTSSGKTILSSYVASLAKKAPVRTRKNAPPHTAAAAEVGGACRVLYIVPTEALVWQVAAHFTRHFRDVSIGFVTNHINFTKQSKIDEPPQVVIGTPYALESALSAIRGNHLSTRKNATDVLEDHLVGGFHHYGID